MGTITFGSVLLTSGIKFTVDPSATGTFAASQTITVDPGAWRASPSSVTTFIDAVIDGETFPADTTFEIPADQDGGTIYFVVTVENSTGSRTAVSPTYAIANLELDAPTISTESATTATTKVIDVVVPADALADDSFELQHSASVDMSTPTTPAEHVLTAGEKAANAFQYSLSGLSVGARHARMRNTRGATDGDWSEILSFVVVPQAPTVSITTPGTDNTPTAQVTLHADHVEGQVIRAEWSATSDYGVINQYEDRPISAGDRTAGYYDSTASLLVPGEWFVRANVRDASDPLLVGPWSDSDSVTITTEDNPLTFEVGALSIQGDDELPLPAGATAITGGTATGFSILGGVVVYNTATATAGTLTFDSGETYTITRPANTYTCRTSSNLAELARALGDITNGPKTIKMRSGESLPTTQVDFLGYGSGLSGRALWTDYVTITSADENNRAKLQYINLSGCRYIKLHKLAVERGYTESGIASRVAYAWSVIANSTYGRSRNIDITENNVLGSDVAGNTAECQSFLLIQNSDYVTVAHNFMTTCYNFIVFGGTVGNEATHIDVIGNVVEYMVANCVYSVASSYVRINFNDFGWGKKLEGSGVHVDPIQIGSPTWDVPYDYTDIEIIGNRYDNRDQALNSQTIFLSRQNASGGRYNNVRVMGNIGFSNITNGMIVQAGNGNIMACNTMIGMPGETTAPRITMGGEAGMIHENALMEDNISHLFQFAEVNPANSFQFGNYVLNEFSEAAYAALFLDYVASNFALNRDVPLLTTLRPLPGGPAFPGNLNANKGAIDTGYIDHVAETHDFPHWDSGFAPTFTNLTDQAVQSDIDSATVTVSGTSATGTKVRISGNGFTLTAYDAGDNVIRAAGTDPVVLTNGQKFKITCSTPVATSGETMNCTVLCGSNRTTWSVGVAAGGNLPVFVGSAANNGNTVAIPAHVAGDILVFVAFNNAATAATVPVGPTWDHQIRYGISGNSLAVGVRTATSDAETSGTWTNADSVYVGVYRDCELGAVGASIRSGSATAPIYTALPFDVVNGSSWLVGMATAVTTEPPLPDGMTKRQGGVNQDGMLLFDSNGGVTGWDGGAFGAIPLQGYKTYTIELKAKAV